MRFNLTMSKIYILDAPFHSPWFLKKEKLNRMLEEVGKTFLFFNIMVLDWISREWDAFFCILSLWVFTSAFNVLSFPTCTTWRCKSKSGLKWEWKFTWTTAIFRISSLFIFLSLIKDDATEKLSYLFQFLVFAFALSQYLCEGILPCEILFWYGILKNFSSTFLFWKNNFLIMCLNSEEEKLRRMEDMSVFFRKTEINI